MCEMLLSKNDLFNGWRVNVNEWMVVGLVERWTHWNSGIRAGASCARYKPND